MYTATAYFLNEIITFTADNVEELREKADGTDVILVEHN